MVNPEGSRYIEIDFLRKVEHQEYYKFIELKYSKAAPHFTKESLDRFVVEHSRQIEKEEKEGDNMKYVFLRK